MSVTPRTWLVTFMSLIFMIGLSAGVLVDRTLLDAQPQPPARGDGRAGDGRGAPGPLGLYGPLGPPPDRYVADLERRLELTPEQRDSILAILEAQRPRVQQLQDDARAEFTAAQQELFAAIAAELTPEQAAAFQQITERQRDVGRGDRGRGGRDRGGRGGRGR